MSDAAIVLSEQLSDELEAVSQSVVLAAQKLESAQNHLQDLTAQVNLVLNTAPTDNNEFMFLLTVFILACFVGYYIIWKVTPALHSPLMSVTNAVSSVIIVGALIAAGPDGLSASKILGFLAVFLASVNIFGGFAVTERMLALFKKKKG
ncbi:MAG: NAD(P) transhydrogenase subunit alpha [Alphaproteobacteria bacterium]|nr:NAD(P) transhydrogenase subunit alpha [Alphaproteobacteria bacterium]